MKNKSSRLPSKNKNITYRAKDLNWLQMSWKQYPKQDIDRAAFSKKLLIKDKCVFQVLKKNHCKYTSILYPLASLKESSGQWDSCSKEMNGKTKSDSLLSELLGVNYNFQQTFQILPYRSSWSQELCIVRSFSQHSTQVLYKCWFWKCPCFTDQEAMGGGFWGHMHVPWQCGHLIYSSPCCNSWAHFVCQGLGWAPGRDRE